MVEIRPMVMGDYDDVLAFWQATEGMGLSSADSREAIGRYLSRNPGLSLVAQAADGQIVGSVLCGHDGRRGFLHHLAVRDDYRGHGLGREMAARCMAALQAEGIDKCHLFVFANNQNGQAFWKKIGWFDRPDLVLMSKDTL